jgi:hypothetical protein
MPPITVINALEWRITVMSIVAEKYTYVVGVDTHARTHTYTIINTTTGARACCEAFPVTTAGMKRAVAWIGRNSTGPVLMAVEGTASYGASLTRTLTGQNITAAEVRPPRNQARAGDGKTDEIDATAAAMTILGKDLEQCCNRAPTSRWPKSAAGVPAPPIASSSRSPARKRSTWPGTPSQQRPV